MSLQVFKADLLKSELVDSNRLRAIWNHHNLQSKSPLIDPLTSFLNSHIEKRGSIKPEMAGRLCDYFHNHIIRKMVKYVEPKLEDVTIAGHNYIQNPSTGIIFEREGEDLVATGIEADGSVHDLHLKHLCLCVTKGWKFRYNGDDYSSPYKM